MWLNRIIIFEMVILINVLYLIETEWSRIVSIIVGITGMYLLLFNREFKI